MVTAGSNLGSFDTSVYTALQTKAASYFTEDIQLNWLPQAIVTPFDAKKYKKPIFGASINVKGAHDHGLGTKMETPQNSREYDLEIVEGNIYFDGNDMVSEGQYLPQRKAGELMEWQHQVKQAIFKGVFTKGFNVDGVGQGVRLNDGLCHQGTLQLDLDGTNSALLAAGDVYKALSLMYGAIPARARDGRQVVMILDDLFTRNARRALYRGATNQISELDLFKQENPEVLFLKSDAILNFVAGTIPFDSAGNADVATEVDVLGTNSRILSAVISPDVLEQAYSNLGLYGEDVMGSIRGLNQRWVARCAGCVHQPTLVRWSESITWA